MPDLADIPGVAELWEMTVGEPAIRVVLVDGPADLTHRSLQGAAIEVIEPTWRSPEIHEAAPGAAESRLEHGTWVASILFGRHGSEISGLAPGCTGLLIPSLRGELVDAEPVNVACTIETAAGAGAHIIVVEACFASLSCDTDDLVRRALRNAARDGVLILAGAGNELSKTTCFPAASPHVLAVGAYDDEGRVYQFSNWGREYDGHGLVAPGGNITGAIPGGGTRVHKGTSCSGPVVAGVAALLLSLQAAHGAVPDPPGVRRALLQSAAPCSARDTDGEPRRCIDGRLDVPAATELVLSELRALARGGHVAAAGTTASSAADANGQSAAGATGPLVFAVGTLGYDFDSQARRDAFSRFMASDPATVDDRRRVAEHLATNPADAGALTWTLSTGGAPLYAVEPVGPYAADVHARLVRLLGLQLAAREEGTPIERVTLPGWLSGRRVELHSGAILASVEVDALRGLHGLDVAALTDAAVAHLRPEGARGDALRAAVGEFLTRVYVDLANAGCTPAQRALNFAATNAYQVADGLAEMLRRRMALEAIDTQRSGACRADSDCWDVVLRFFDPDNGRRARRLLRFTVDVSDIVPVTLGAIRGWPESAAARAAA